MPKGQCTGVHGSLRKCGQCRMPCAMCHPAAANTIRCYPHRDASAVQGFRMQGGVCRCYQFNIDAFSSNEIVSHYRDGLQYVLRLYSKRACQACSGRVFAPSSRKPPTRRVLPRRVMSHDCMIRTIRPLQGETIPRHFLKLCCKSYFSFQTRNVRYPSTAIAISKPRAGYATAPFSCTHPSPSRTSSCTSLRPASLGG